MWAVSLILLSIPAGDSLTGTVLALASGHALAGVVVTAGNRQTTSDSAGHFALAGSASRLHLTWDGKSGVGMVPSPEVDEPLRVVVDTEAPNLETTIEHVDWHLVGRWGMAGFFDRARQGYGTFFTRHDLARSGYTALKELLASLGITHGCLRTGDGCGAMIYYRGTPTLVSIYVDGVFQRNEQADDLPLDAVTGIEYYPLPSALRPRRTIASEWIVRTDYLQQLPLQEFSVVIWTRAFYQRLAER
ncbi:MAG TPA: carboxypeptidase-like regulatory domain-containing protein [Gemmatimonadales bacterium]|nr:carboxypeptidase-like regulatory domain-containing protein [Gemmatimonadales bacterium]